MVYVLLAIGGALTASSIYLLLAESRTSTLRRLEEPAAITDQTTGERGNPWLGLRDSLQAGVGNRFEKSARGFTLRQTLNRAGIQLWPAEWVAMSLGASGLMAALLTLRFGSLITLPVGLGLGYLAPQMVLKFLVRRRDRKFEKQLGPTLLALSNAVKAGHTFAQALALAAEGGTPPMSKELTRVVHEVQLGRSMTEALMRLVERNESEELRLMVVAVKIQGQVGGNLTEILSNIEMTIRERVRINGDVRTLTAQARASGWILIALPVALAGILSTIAPTYFGPMLSKPIGQVMLGIAGFAMICGYAIIKKIVAVDV